jgi:hypothetical protein
MHGNLDLVVKANRYLNVPYRDAMEDLSQLPTIGCMAHSSKQEHFIGQGVPEAEFNQLPPLEHSLLLPFANFVLWDPISEMNKMAFQFVNCIAVAVTRRIEQRQAGVSFVRRMVMKG